MKKLNVFRLGLLFAGCFLGAGYVSGQELRQYFVVYGAKGYLGLLAAVAILCIFGVLCPAIIVSFASRCFSLPAACRQRETIETAI